MSNQIALIERFEFRMSTCDLKKLEYITSELRYGENKSKTLRRLISEYAELLAWQAHQQEEVEQYKCT